VLTSALAWRGSRRGRPLNIAGFAFTSRSARHGCFEVPREILPPRNPSGALLLFYLGISILFTLRQPVKLTGYIDGTLIFGTPIVVFALQSAMLRDRVMALAYSAIAMSAMYLTTAWLLKTPAQ